MNNRRCHEGWRGLRPPLITATLLTLLGLTPARAADSAPLTVQPAGDAPVAVGAGPDLAAGFGGTIDRLLPALTGDGQGRGAAQAELHRLACRVGRPGAEAEREAFCRILGLRLAQAPMPAQVWMIRELERCGRDEAVPALAAALDDDFPLVREQARRALAANPAPAAREALLAARDRSRNAGLRTELLMALAWRATAQDLPLFQTEVISTDVARCQAACIALRRIGDADTVPLLQAVIQSGQDSVRPFAVSAVLAIAVRLEQKDRPTAVAIYRTLLPTTGERSDRCAGLRGLGRLGGDDAVAVLALALEDADAVISGSAAAALEDLHRPAANAALLAKAATTRPMNRSQVIAALGRCGERKALPAVLTALDAEGPDLVPVRLAACQAAALLGDATTVPRLLRVAVTNPPDEQQAAREALATLRADGVDAELTRLLAKGSDGERAECERALAARGVAAGTGRAPAP